MLVKKGYIIGFDLVSVANLNKDKGAEPDICVRFYLSGGERFTVPCFYSAGFDVGAFPESDAIQIQRTQAYLDSFDDDTDVAITPDILYNMDAYH